METMNKERKKLFKNSKKTAHKTTKKAIKNINLVEEGVFPTYMVVLGHDKNDDIMVIHPIDNSSPNDAGKPSKLPGDKSLLRIT
jgi:hypothetical protein